MVPLAPEAQSLPISRAPGVRSRLLSCLERSRDGLGLLDRGTVRGLFPRGFFSGFPHSAREGIRGGHRDCRQNIFATLKKRILIIFAVNTHGFFLNETDYIKLPNENNYIQ